MAEELSSGLPRKNSIWWCKKNSNHRQTTICSCGTCCYWNLGLYSAGLGMPRLHWALFRIWSTILHFQHSWALSWLVSRIWEFCAFWATFKHFFTIFQYFVFETFLVSRVILLSWIWIISPSRPTVVMKMCNYPFNRGSSWSWKKKALVFHFLCGHLLENRALRNNSKDMYEHLLVNN